MTNSLEVVQGNTLHEFKKATQSRAKVEQHIPSGLKNTALSS